MDRLNSLDTLPASALVSDREIAKLVGVSPATVWRWAKSGLMPAPQRISARCTRWKLGDVRKALAEKCGS